MIRISLLTAILLNSFTIISAQSKENNVNENLIPFQSSDHKWGYLDAMTGQQILEPKYDQVSLFINGIAEIANFNPNAKNKFNSSLFGFIDTTGKVIFPPEFTAQDKVKDSQGIIIPNLIQLSGEGEKTGIARLNGTWLVPIGKYQKFQFYNAHQFLADDRFYYDNGNNYSVPKGYQITQIYAKNKLFEVKKHEMFTGIISWEGKIIVPAKYLDVTYYPTLKRFVGSRLKLKATLLNIKSVLIKSSNPKVKDPIVIDLMDENGSKIASFPSQYQANGYKKDDHLITYEYLGESHFVNLLTGKAVNPPKEKTILGYEVFYQGDYQGLKDNNGKIIVPAKFLKLKAATANLIIAESSEIDKYGIINKVGKLTAPFEFNSLEYMANNHFRAEKNGKYGVIDGQGRTIIKFKYQLGTYFDENGLADVYADSGQGVIDTTGKEIIPAIYKSLFNTQQTEKTQETYYEAEKGGRWGLLDSTGKIIVPFNYGFVSCREADFKTGWVLIDNSKRSHHGLYNIKTGVIIPTIYDITEVFPDFLIVAKRIDNDYQYQLLNNAGKPLTEIVYNKMNYTFGYLSCRKDKLCGVLDTKGKTIVPFKYRYLWEETPHLLYAQQGDDYFYINTQGKEFKAP